MRGGGEKNDKETAIEGMDRARKSIRIIPDARVRRIIIKSFIFFRKAPGGRSSRLHKHSFCRFLPEFCVKKEGSPMSAG